MEDVADLLLNRFLQAKPGPEDAELVPEQIKSESSIKPPVNVDANGNFRIEYAHVNKYHFPHLEYCKIEPECGRPPNPETHPPNPQNSRPQNSQNAQNAQNSQNAQNAQNAQHAYWGAGPDLLERAPSTRLTGPDCDIVTSEGALGTSRANVFMNSGEWYFEIEVLNANIQCGITRRESLCDAPLGYNVFSYGVMGPSGEYLHYGLRYKGCRPLQEGDIVGFHVKLPQKIIPDDLVRTRAPFKRENTIMLESVDYAGGVTSTIDVDMRCLLDPLPEKTLKNSFCKISVNGVWQQVPLAEPLRDFNVPHSHLAFEISAVDDISVGYYPAVTVFDGGAARFRLGPDFQYAKPATARPLSERFDEQIGEDLARDLLHETCFAVIDECIPEEMQNRPPLRAVL